MLKTKRSRNTKFGASHGGGGDNKHKLPSDKPIRLGKSGSSDSTENFASKSSKPGASLQIWQRSEYSVNANDPSELQWEDTELQQIWAGAGGLGTTAKVEVDRSASDGSRESRHSHDGAGHVV